jgi:signal transduction histidine kinase
MFSYNIYALPPLLASAIILTLGIYVWIKNINSTLNFSWFLVCFSMFVWLLGDFFLFSTRDYNLAVLLSRLVYIGVTGIPFSLVYFALKITKASKSKLIAIVLIFLLIVTATVLLKTNLCVNGLYKFYWGFYPRAGKFHELFLLFWLTIYIIAAVIIYNKTRSVVGKEKMSLTYVFWALFFGGIIGPLDFIPKYGFEFYPIGYFCIPLITATVAFAILKYSLLDIKIVVKKSLLYSTLIGVLTAIYLLLVMSTEYFFKGIVGYKSLIISLLSAFIIANIFNPLRNNIQMFIDRIFLGKTSHEIAKENELLRQEIERSERLKTANTLALGLAHEIRNPLTTIKTFAEYLPEKYKDVEFVKKFSRIIPSEVDRINSIIKQLLDFSKPSPPSFKETNICRLIKEILGFLNSEFLKQKIKLNEIYEDPDLLITIDPSQIKQAILNIILNAVESMPKGGVIAIQTKTGAQDFLEIRIVDEGCGIANDTIKRIFDPFFSTKDTGTGLGLSITHQIIKNQNGSIVVESKLGKGSTFIIKLPLKKDWTD